MLLASAMQLGSTIGVAPTLITNLHASNQRMKIRVPCPLFSEFLPQITCWMVLYCKSTIAMEQLKPIIAFVQRKLITRQKNFVLTL